MSTRCGPRLAAVLACVCASHCASYAPLPLARGGGLKQRLDALDYGGQALPPKLGPDEIGLLALRNNPDLRAARLQRGVAQAQLLAAGIPPNPSLGGSYGFLLGGPGNFDAISAGLSQDLKSLVTLSAKRRAAHASVQEVDASLLWQEWQTVGKARLLAVDLIAADGQLRALRDQAELLDGRLRRSRAALAAGDASLATVTPDLTAAADAHKQLDDLRRQQQTLGRDLDALLGLSPEVPLPLAAAAEPPPVVPERVRALLADLADRRPDLVALQLGYRAQEQKLRAAVLAQFPTLSLGPAYASDTSDVRTLGPQITLELPLFDRNQGNIAQERASREQLHEEFRNRLDAARSEVLGLLADLAVLQQQLLARQPQLAELDRTAAQAQRAFEHGDLDERSLVDLLSARNGKRMELLSLQQTVYEQQVAIATLTGAGMPPVNLPPEGR